VARASVTFALSRTQPPVPLYRPTSRRPGHVRRDGRDDGSRRLGREIRDDVLMTMETMAICEDKMSRSLRASAGPGARRRESSFSLSLSKVPSSCLIEFCQPGGANLFTKYLRK